MESYENLGIEKNIGNKFTSLEYYLDDIYPNRWKNQKSVSGNKCLTRFIEPLR